MKKVFFLFIIMLCFSCGKTLEKQQDSSLSFYYWRTHFTLDSIERVGLKELNVKKLYIRYFDVALKDNKAIPISPVIFKDAIPAIVVVPVIYIKNEVVLKEGLNTAELAIHLLDFVKQINEKNQLMTDELQLDCDWTLTSKDRFFDLIKELKKLTKAKISVTIRLHQVKYASKTGVPEVDHGALMYYNMGQIAGDTLNSIYDRNIAKKYVGSLKEYPLRLNYALPIYSWLIQSRRGQVVKLISRVRVEDVEKNIAFERISANGFVVLEEGTYFGQYFKVDDQLKVETTTNEQLLEMIHDLRESSGKCPQEIILYDLNSKNLVFYDKETFEKLVRCN